MSLLLKNGLVVSSSRLVRADVYVDGGTIRAVGPGLEMKADETVDAAGMYVLPGCIDPHTHLDMPYNGTTTADDWATGTAAAACGGTTTVIDFSMQGKGETLQDAVERHKEKAKAKAAIDYGIHPAVSDARPDVIDEVRKAIHEYGTPSLKVYMAYDFRVDDYAMLRLLEETGKHGGLLEVHAENYDIIRRASERFAAEGSLAPLYHAKAHSVLAEEEAVGRAATMAEATGSRLYVVHLSSARGLERVRQARRRGVGILAETCPQYLTLTEERYAEPDWAGAKYVMSPPLRTRDDADALWQALREGELQTLGTDHCPFNFKGQKDMAGRSDFRKIPNGAPGIETMLMLLHSEGVVKGRISLQRMVEALSASSARIFGLKDKGEIAPGKDADIVVFDPNRRFSISRDKLHQNVDYTPWEGWQVTGMPDIVYARGRRAAEWAGDRMRFVGEPGWGRFVKRAAFTAP